jgi:hypothetical protein
LFQLERISLCGNGDPGHSGVGRGGTADGFNIVASSGKESCDSGRDTGFVFHQHGKDMFFLVHNALLFLFKVKCFYRFKDL